MADTTPDVLKEQLKKSGLLLLKDGKYYFIPNSDLTAKYQLPGAFQSGAIGVSATYFEKFVPTGQVEAPNLDTAGRVYGKITEALNETTFSLDGVEKALWLDAAEPVGDNLQIKAHNSRSVVFVYKKTGNRILVDAVKGARPSNR